MKQGFLLSIIATTSLLGGDYGFRDYLVEYIKADNRTAFGFTSIDEKTTVIDEFHLIDKYCVIEGGVMYGDVTYDLGTESLPAHDKETLSKYLSLSKDDRKKELLTKSRIAGLWLSKEEMTFNANINNYKSIECKLPNNSILFSTRKKGWNWVVQHDSEAIKDFIWSGRTFKLMDSDQMKQALSQKYPTHDAYFDSYDSSNKLNGNYRLSKKISVNSKIKSITDMDAIGEMFYFCEANQGAFYKESTPFRGFLKDLFVNKSGYAWLFDENANGYKSPFVGTYSCHGGQTPFTMQLSDAKPSSANLTVNFDYALIKKGIDTTPSAPIQPVTNNMNIMNSAVGYNTSMSSSLSPSDEKLIRKATILKVPYGEQQGSNITTALYNGMDAQGCHQIALQKTVANMPVNVAPKNTYNYKVCGTQIMALGETGLPGLPRAKEIAPIITQVKNQCKAYGAYGSEYQGTVVSCRALDQNHCNLEISILQNGIMIDKRVENSCK